jgi:hypothetical protein
MEELHENIFFKDRNNKEEINTSFGAEAKEYRN